MQHDAVDWFTGKDLRKNVIACFNLHIELLFRVILGFKL